MCEQIAHLIIYIYIYNMQVVAAFELPNGLKSPLEAMGYARDGWWPSDLSDPNACFPLNLARSERRAN